MNPASTLALLLLLLLQAPHPAAARQPPPNCSITTVAGTLRTFGNASGPAGAATFDNTAGVSVDPLSGAVALAENTGYQLRGYDPATGLVSTLAGSGKSIPFADGPAEGATLYGPRGLCRGGAPGGGPLYVMDTMSRRVRALEGGLMSTVSGNGSSGCVSGLWRAPSGCAWDGANGQLLVTDFFCHTLRGLDLATGLVTSLAGRPNQAGYLDGPGSAAQFNRPFGLAVSGRFAYVADSENNGIRWVALAPGPPPDGASGGVQLYDVGTLAGCDTNPVVVGAFRLVDGVGTNALFRFPNFVVADRSGGGLFVADSQNMALRHVDIASTAVTTVAGNGSGGWADGSGTASLLNYPLGMALLPEAAQQGAAGQPDSPSLFYVADTYNALLRRVNCTFASPAPSAAPSAAPSPGAPSAVPGGAAADLAPELQAALGVGVTVLLGAGGFFVWRQREQRLQKRRWQEMERRIQEERERAARLAVRLGPGVVMAAPAPMGQGGGLSPPMGLGVLNPLRAALGLGVPLLPPPPPPPPTTTTLPPLPTDPGLPEPLEIAPAPAAGTGRWSRLVGRISF